MITQLTNGNYKLTGTYGVHKIGTNDVYSEVEGDMELLQQFEPIEEQERESKQK